MPLAGLDLNLLLALHALLEERNVTRAGRRLGLSQPSASALLARLRKHFGDQLLLRVGNHYELTPLAVTLRSQAAAAVNVVERTFATRSSFDPATTDREFSIMLSDYAVALFGDALLRRFREGAPGASLRLREISTLGSAPDLEATLRTCDGIVLPHGFVSGYPAVDLCRDRWVGIVAEGNDSVGDSIEVADLGKLPWVVIYHGQDNLPPVFRQLIAFGVEPRVDGVVDTFQPLPLLVSGSDRVGLLPERLALRFRELAGVRVVGLPFDAGPIVDAFWWHPAHTHDPAHQWLRETVQDASAHLR